jgi:hypothetical protein
MMRGIVVSFALLAAGCGGNSYVQFASSGSPATGVSTGGSVQVQGSATFAALLAIGILAGASYASDREYEASGMQRRSSPFEPLPRSRAVPGLDATRTVNEQDCSRPIVDWSANLKCK